MFIVFSFHLFLTGPEFVNFSVKHCPLQKHSGFKTGQRMNRKSAGGREGLGKTHPGARSDSVRGGVVSDGGMSHDALQPGGTCNAPVSLRSVLVLFRGCGDHMLS